MELEFIPATEKMLQEHIGSWLHTERTRKHLTLRELEKKSGIPQKTLSRIEHCNPNSKRYNPKYNFVPSLTTLMKICNAFEVPIASIFISNIVYVYF